MNTKHIIITLAVLTGISSWGASHESKKKRKRSNDTSSDIPEPKRPCPSLGNQNMEPVINMAETTAGESDRPAYLPPEVMGHMAMFVDQQTLQRLAEAGAGRAGAASGFTEIARREKAARLLAKHNGNAQEALFDAAKNNYPWAIGYLIQHGAKVNKKEIGHYGKTPLMLAVLKGHEAVVDKLITAGVDVNTTIRSGHTALIYAATYGHEAIVAQLIAAGANVNVAEINGDTALMLAIQNGHEAIVAQLIAANADVNVQDDQGFTALMQAALLGPETVAALLIAKGADVNAKNKRGGTTLTLAIRHNHEAIAKLLIQADADISILNDEQIRQLAEWIGG